MIVKSTCSELFLLENPSVINRLLKCQRQTYFQRYHGTLHTQWSNQDQLCGDNPTRERERYEIRRI